MAERRGLWVITSGIEVRKMGHNQNSRFQPPQSYSLNGNKTMYECMNVGMNECMCKDVYTFMYIFFYICVLLMLIYVYTYVDFYVSIYIYTYTKGL